MKAYRGSRGTVLLILNLGASWSSVVNITPLLLHLWERTLVLTELEAGWDPQPVHMFWRGEKSFATARIWTLDHHSAHSLVTIPTTHEFCTLYMVCCQATAAERKSLVKIHFRSNKEVQTHYMYFTDYCCSTMLTYKVCHHLNWYRHICVCAVNKSR
jgi:hypothetical protein